MIFRYDADYIVFPYGTLTVHHVFDAPEVETSGNKMGRPAGTDKA